MDDAGIYARESTYLDCYVQVGYASGKALSVSFPAEPDESADGDHPLLDRITAYLEGEEVDFSDVEIALTMPTDRRTVLEKVRDIPYGEQVSVERLATMTAGLNADEMDDLQLVRTALDENPAPLLIPDHRVRDGPSAAPPEIEQRLRSLESL